MKQARSPFSGVKAIAKKLLGRQGFDRTEYSNSSVLKPIGEPYDFSHFSYPDRIVFNETFVETLPDIFRNFDLAGMMNSVEIRMPFMDWRLVTYQFSLPIQSKIGSGYNKLVLREAMKGRMAEEIRTRKMKIGISSPINSWLNHILKEWVLDNFQSSSANFLGLSISRKQLETELQTGTVSQDLSKKIWLAINLKMIE
jgi:asparagine synthase (glutamine-hydrolysing)